MARVVIGCLFLGLGASAIVGTWITLIGTRRTGRSISLVPVICGSFAFIGCALLPPIGWKLGLIFFVLDPGCLFLIAWPFVALVGKLRDRGELI